MFNQLIADEVINLPQRELNSLKTEAAEVNNENQDVYLVDR